MNNFLATQNASELYFDLSRSLKVKSDGVIKLPLYTFLLMFNSNLWPNSAPLRNIRLENLSDIDFYLSMSLKVKLDNATELPIYGFLLMVNNNIGSI